MNPIKEITTTVVAFVIIIAILHGGYLLFR